MASKPEVGGGGARQAAGLPRAGREVEEEGEGSAPPSEALLRGRSQLSGAGAYLTEEENYILTINVPVVYMARYRYVLVLRCATSLRGALEGVGPENRDFLGPEMATSEASAIWAQKPPTPLSPFCTLYPTSSAPRR